METDTIRNGIVFHLADDDWEIAANVDKETGSVSYSIAIAPDESAAVEDNDSHGFLWLGVALAVVATVLFAVKYLLKKNRSNDVKVKTAVQEKSLRQELLKQKDIYKSLCKKGYFSTVRKNKLAVVEESEINELCEAVSEIFPTFVEFLNNHGLSAKDFQFCCLMRSGLTTFELSEIYCVSESAVFKRKQKIKELTGFKSDKRTFDAIVEEI
ncbi:MAG: hypothetical protein MJZ85_07160 [Bacteroidales bacterium]|nr:hypothetical protein [Bacteroidales bacterium]